MKDKNLPIQLTELEEPSYEVFSEYQSSSTRSETKSKLQMYSMILLVVILGVLAAQFIYDKLTNSHRISDFISTMKSKVGKDKSAPPNTKKVTHDAHMKSDETLKKSKVQNLTPCDPNDSTCSDIKKVTTEVKNKSDEEILNFLLENDDAIIMVYAPWCGHCHNAMPHLHKASEKSSIPCALINAELVSEELLAGKVFDVKYFPFIVRRTKKGETIEIKAFEDQPSEDNLVKFGA